MSNTDFQVGILGGGPAGSGLASYLAKNGVSCVLLERELFPRPHVGESLVPSSTRVFKEIGFLPKMEEAKFPHKYGAAWTTTDSRLVAAHDWEGLGEDSRVDVDFCASEAIRSGGPSLPLDADHKVDIQFQEREQEGVDQLYTYHVDRGKFDLLMLQHAQQLGAKVCEGLRVDHVDFDHGGPPTIHTRLGEKKIDFKVQIVVDATGRNTLLGRQLKLRVTDPVFNQFAFHTWFENFDRKSAGKEDFIFIHFIPLSNTWVWQIPITDTITSIGVVTQKKHFAGTKQTREEFFWKCVGQRPDLYERLKKADQIRGFTEEADYSYAMTQFCGDRYLLVGDAARFVDPIFSSGVSIALNSGRIAHPRILSALETGNFERASFAEYERVLRLGTQNWYKFITLYYRLNILFTYFLSTPRYRLDILKLLQGDVYDESEPPVLEKMRQTVNAVEDNPDHPWHQLLGDLTANAFKHAI